MSNVLKVFELLVACSLCGCVENTPNPGVDVFDTMEFEINQAGVDLSLNAFYEVQGADVVIYIVNNTRKMLAVDISGIEHNCTIRYNTQGGKTECLGGMAISRCGPCELSLLSPLRFPENKAFELNSTVSVKLTLPKGVKGIEKVFFPIPCVGLDDLAHCDDYDDLEKLLWNRRIWVVASNMREG